MTPPLTVDVFCGGGGASTGIAQAIERPVDIAIDWDPALLAIHKANHPRSTHVLNDAALTDPARLARGRPVGLAWFSPDCRMHSRARSSRQPLTAEQQASRELAWTAERWARVARPRLIIVENVSELRHWGPLNNGLPDKNREGETFRCWLQALQEAGYHTGIRELNAADYGAPTKRRRLFIVARGDGRPIIWPQPTHGPGRNRPHRAALDCIDSAIPTPSIFLPEKEARALGAKRPLAEKTMLRIARGMQLFRGAPVIIPVTHADEPSRVYPTSQPLHTITAAREFALAICHLERLFGTETHADLQKPMPAITASGQGNTALVGAWISHLHGSNTNGGDSSLRRPLNAITASGKHKALVTALLRRGRVSPGGQGELFHAAEPARIQIDDIGMRMLSPRELFLAQGFPATYRIAETPDGEPVTKEVQVRAVGNSVPPPLARALVAANLDALEEGRRRPAP